jgi:hypothetical protein
MINANDLAETLSLDETESLLAPHLERLANCIQAGWDKWLQLQSDPAGYAVPLHYRTRASFVNVKEQFANVRGAEIPDNPRGLRLLTLENQITIRFKKLDKHFQSRNIPTNQQVAFARQLSLEGIPPLTRLTAGYILNQLQTDIATIAITKPAGSSLEWSFTLPGTQMKVTPFSTADAEMIRTRRIKVKKIGDEQRASNE